MYAYGKSVNLTQRSRFVIVIVAAGIRSTCLRNEAMDQATHSFPIEYRRQQDGANVKQHTIGRVGAI